MKVCAFAAAHIICVSMGHGQAQTSAKEKALAGQYLKTGNVKYKARDYKGALADFTEAIGHDPLNGRAHRRKGDAEQELNQFKEAVLSYSIALGLNKGDTLSYKGRAESSRFSGNYKESLSDYNTAIEWDPTDTNMFFGRALSYYNLREYKKSLIDHGTVIKRYPKDPSSYFWRCAEYVALRQYLEAYRDIKKYFELGGKDDGAYYFAGLTHTRLGDNNPRKLDSAIADLTRYTHNKDEAKTKDPLAYQTLGIAYSKKGDTTNAHKNFERSLELDPNNANTYFRWGSCELNLNNPKKANELIGKARQMTKDPSPYLLVYYAVAKIGIGDTIEAVNNFAEALKQDSSLSEAYERRAVFLFNNNKYHKMVLDDFDHLIRFSKEDNEKAEGHSLKSMVDMHVKDTLAAELEVEKAIKLMPEEPFHYMVRALLNANIGKDQGTVLKDVDKALRLDPTMTEAHLFKATYYAIHGDHKNGCEALKYALKTGSNVPKETQDYICKGKKPKDGKVPDLFVPISPRLRKMPEYNYEE